MEATVSQIAARLRGSYGMARVVIRAAQQLIDVAVNRSMYWDMIGPELLPGTNTRVQLQQQIEDVATQLGSNSFPDDYECPLWSQVQTLYRSARAEAAAVDEGRAQTIANELAFVTDVAEGVVDVAIEAGKKVASTLGDVLWPAALVAVVVLVVLYGPRVKP
jgi:hypothetical protein